MKPAILSSLILVSGLCFACDLSFAKTITAPCRDITCNKNIHHIDGHLYTVQIPQNEFNLVLNSPDQEKSHWCWAASLQMVLKLIGSHMNQADIVRKVHQKVDNTPATPKEMVKFINGWHKNDNGQNILLFSYIEYFIPQIIFDLANGFPVILDMKVDRKSNHSYLITGAKFLYFDNKPPILTSVTARDPWKGNPKFKIFNFDTLSGHAHLIIGVREYIPQ